MSNIKEDLIVNCFKCQKAIFVVYSPPHQKYSSKNNWEYWTENEENKEKYICNSCILNLYFRRKKEYLRNIVAKKKREVLRSYINCKRFD